MTISTDSVSNAPPSQNSQGGIMPPSSDEIALNRANAAYLIAICLAAVFGAAGIGATFFVISYSNRVSAAQGRQVQQLQRDRDVARAEAARADARIAEANAQAEAARKIAAEAQAATASAVLATEELRKQTTGRTMPDDQINEISNALRGSGIHLQIECPFGDAEAAIYAAQVNIMLNANGVDVGKVNLRYDGMFFGIAVLGPDDAYTQAIRKSFEDRGTKVRYTDAPTYSLYIGNRLPPFVQP